MAEPAFTVEMPLSFRATRARAPTVEELQFISRINRTFSKISRLGPKKSRQAYEQAIADAAKVGLQDPGDLRTGNAGLDGIESDFVEEEGPGLRRRFLEATLAHSAAVFLIAVSLALYIQCRPAWSSCFADVRDILFDGAWVAAGASVGIVFFAFVNSLTITFENAGKFDSTGLGPTLRLAFVAIVLIVLATLLQTNALVLGIGGQTLNNFRNSSQLAFLLGLFGAYSDIQATRLIASVLDRSAERRGQAT